MGTNQSSHVGAVAMSIKGHPIFVDKIEAMEVVRETISIIIPPVLQFFWILQESRFKKGMGKIGTGINDSRLYLL